jgi:hypothetical protein
MAAAANLFIVVAGDPATVEATIATIGTTISFETICRSV